VTKVLGGRAAPGPTGEASALSQRVRVQLGRGPILLREEKGGEGKREEMGGEKGLEFVLKSLILFSFWGFAPRSP